MLKLLALLMVVFPSFALSEAIVVTKSCREDIKPGESVTSIGFVNYIIKRIGEYEIQVTDVAGRCYAHILTPTPISEIRFPTEVSPAIEDLKDPTRKAIQKRHFNMLSRCNSSPERFAAYRKRIGLPEVDFDQVIELASKEEVNACYLLVSSDVFSLEFVFQSQQWRLDLVAGKMAIGPNDE